MDIFKEKKNKETGSSTKTRPQAFCFVIPSQKEEEEKKIFFTQIPFYSNKATPGGVSGLPGDYRYCNWLLLVFHNTQRCNYPFITITFVN